MFEKYANNRNVKYYFEFGSGGSTYYMTNLDHVERIYCVESDITWVNKLKGRLGDNVKKVEFMAIPMKVQPNNWGYPDPNGDRSVWPEYSNAIDKIDATSLNLILIDGRFRVACALKVYQAISDDCLVIFDDFLDRPHYHDILKYYEIIESTANRSMAILKKKPGQQIDATILSKYQIDPR